METIINTIQNRIRNKNILITGSTTGIGRATAILLSQMGANVLITGTNAEHMQDALKDLEKTSGGQVFHVLADLGTEEGINKLFDVVDENFSHLDVLINNVALPFGNISEGNYVEWERVLNTNLLAYIACCAEGVKRMSKPGHIINIGSMSADVREGSGSIYVATKSGIQGFSESLRKQLNKEEIKVSLIEPGAVDTNMQEGSAEEKRQKIDAAEMLKAEDIAWSVLYCLSQSARCDVVELKIRPHKQLI